MCTAEGVPGEAGVVHAADAWFDRSPRLLLGGVRGTAGPAPAGTPPAAAAARGWSVGIALTAAARGGRVREDEGRRHLPRRQREVCPGVWTSDVPRGGVVRPRRLLRGVEGSEP